MINAFVIKYESMISVLTIATLSASQLSGLAFSPSAFAHTRQNDFNIKLVAEVGVEPTVLSGLILSQLGLPVHHPAKSEALAKDPASSQSWFISR